MKDRKMSRREFVKVGTTGTAALLLSSRKGLGAATMPERPFGKTGHNVRLFSLGGQATLEKEGTLDESVAIINRAIDLGVNYIDTAAAYGKGISQKYIGEVMATRRKEVFLATKTHKRTRDESMQLLEESLTSLKTDHLDLWQLHNVRTDEQLETIFGKDGAIEALEQARSEKIVRFLGITGHFDPDVLARALRRYDFDTILMALNPSDPHFQPFTKELLPLANKQNLGVIAMKIPARGRLFRSDGLNSMSEAMTWTLSHPVSTCIVGCDTVAQLEENISIATNFEPMDEAKMAEISGLTAGYAAEASFFKKDGAGFGAGGGDDQDTDD
jgi:aryl-alcohol dehydrogenase-like predicted oxidoreductase